MFGLAPRNGSCNIQQLEESASKAHLTVADHRVIVTWVENKNNFDAIHGLSDKPAVGGKPKITKDEGFKRLAVYVTQRTKNTKLRRDLAGDKMWQRWSSVSETSSTSERKRSLVAVKFSLSSSSPSFVDNGYCHDVDNVSNEALSFA
ncbi:unnamed protein product [Phytophthora fragariaefolia]|uniref:Unnamed protein product n=1 Tax=Phytophthora fragariaefolia TaxID=1490495 RepID=A0A9W6WZ51_9STRA|nr:unnamed protein product [Phytophthora fragariaefolia]